MDVDGDFLMAMPVSQDNVVDAVLVYTSTNHFSCWLFRIHKRHDLTRVELCWEVYAVKDSGIFGAKSWL